MRIPNQARQTRENSAGWMIQRLARRLAKAMNARVERHGLDTQRFAIMMTVLERGNPSQADLGETFAMPAYAVSRALDALEKDELIKREKHPQSRRAHQIRPTRKGLDIAPELFAAVRVVNDDLTAGLDDKEAETLKRLLAKVLTTTQI